MFCIILVKISFTGDLFLLPKSVEFHRLEERSVIAILVAKTEEQELFYLTGKYGRKELHEIRSLKQFFCPSCQAPLVMKIGEINIPHFAHRTLSSCDTFSEPESSLHLHGKLLLHRFFQQLNFKVELEKYLQEIRQRADLLVNGQYAIEFQCSPIAVPQLKKRSEGYHQLNMQPLWIKGLKEPCLEEIGLLRLKTHEIAMRQITGQESHILLFHPTSNRFYYHSNLFYISPNRWVAKTRSLQTSSQVFPFAVPKLLSKEEFNIVMGIFQNAKQQYIRNQLYVQNRVKNTYCRLCYELRMDMTNLPKLIGIPVKGAECIKQTAVMWQLHAIAAWEKGIPMGNLIESGKLTLAAGADGEGATKMLDEYLLLYLPFKDKPPTDSNILNIAYDNYCKSL